MTKAHAAASAPNTTPRTALSSRFTAVSVTASSDHRAARRESDGERLNTISLVVPFRAGSAWRF